MLNTLINFIKYPSVKKNNLQRKIRTLTGINPGNIALYQFALTHKSFPGSADNYPAPNNERLEYLGDAILSAVIADYLFIEYPDSKEGLLTQMRSKLVNRDNLNKIAKKLGFEDLVLLDNNNIPLKKNIYGNALEALIGAIYTDKGFLKARKFIIQKIIRSQAGLDQLSAENQDFKSQIIQWGQKNRQEVSFESYELTEEENLRRSFISAIYITDIRAGEGLGSTKKEAQQNAARHALENLPSYAGSLNNN
ncbi:MAG: ribonuclease III [Bacteroidales bacterium]